MMVPGSRLILWVALIFAPFAAIAGMIPEAAFLAYGIMGCACLVFVGDAVLGRGSLDHITVSMPEIVRASTGRNIEIPISFYDSKKQGLVLRIGIAFPDEIMPEKKDLEIRLPKNSKSSTISCPVIPRRTGCHVIDGVYMETASLLGFWTIRAKSPACTQIRVFPNLMREKTGLASLFLRSGLGQHVQRQIGKGRDFDQLREYFPGDSFGDIHWKATAKRGRPITKVFQIERTQKVYVVIDASRLSARNIAQLGPDDSTDNESATILERFVTAALVMGLATQRNGDMFGLITFADKIKTFVRARSGKVQYNVCRDALYTLEPGIVTPDFAELFSFVGANIRHRALLLFLTNLDDTVLFEDFIKHVSMVGNRHLMVVNTPIVKDARPLFSTPDIKDVDGLYKSMGGHLLWERTRKVQRILKQKGVGFYQLENEKMCAQLVSQYISIKQRQLI